MVLALSCACMSHVYHFCIVCVSMYLKFASLGLFVRRLVAACFRRFGFASTLASAFFVGFGVQRLNFVCAVCYFLCSSVGWVVSGCWILFSELCVAVTSRLSGAGHLFIMSLSREMSFSLRLR